MQTRYTIRSEGGTLTAEGSNNRGVAMGRALQLAVANEGQRILLCRDGEPVKDHAWCSGPKDEVQR